MTARSAPLLFALAAMLVALPLGAQSRVRLGGRDAAVWSPPGGGRAPLVLWSHGLGGCHTQPGYLLRAIAARGFWVVSVRHGDAGCGAPRRARGAAARPPFATPARWSAASFADRRDDVRAVHEALRRDPRYALRMDFTRYALAGHSLGGYTALGLAGAWPSWLRAGDVAPSAVLALCPYLAPFTARGTLAGLHVPVMFQGGTRDMAITHELRRAGGAFDQTAGVRHLAVFAGASHLTWGGPPNATHDDIVRYAVAFLERYVLGRPADPVLRSGAGLAEYRVAGR